MKTNAKVATMLCAAAAVLLSGLPADAQMRVLHGPIRGPRPHICRPGQVWQLGCLVYAPRQPGQLVPACLKTGYGCFRAPGQIQ